MAQQPPPTNAPRGAWGPFPNLPVPPPPTGITQLTHDVLAGPGNGSVAATVVGITETSGPTDLPIGAIPLNTSLDVVLIRAQNESSVTGLPADRLLLRAPMDLFLAADETALPYEGEAGFFILNQWLQARTTGLDPNDIPWEWEIGNFQLYTAADLDVFVYEASGMPDFGDVALELTLNGGSIGLITPNFTAVANTRYTALGFASFTAPGRIGMRLVGTSADTSNPVRVRLTAHVRLR